MDQLKNTDFSWHADQPDVPGMTADEMKAFLDAPAKRLMEKINEIIGGESSESLHNLSAKLVETIEILNQKADDVAVSDALAQLWTALDGKAEETDFREALANLDTLHREELAYKASTNQVEEAMLYLKTECQDSLDALATKEAEDHLEQAAAIEKLAAEKQDKLIPGAGISILDNVISAEVGAEFAPVQDDVTSDLPNGFCRFEDPGDESRTLFNLYLLQDNGNGGIEPGTGLTLERGSVALKTAVGQGYFIIVFCKAGGYLIYNSGLADEMTEMAFSNYVKTNDYTTYQKAGLVRVTPNYGMLICDTGSGVIGLIDTTPVYIDIRETETRPIAVTTKVLDYAVKAAITDCKLTWTEEEKAAARALLGIE
ncbi:MAG: hypothetical protein IJN42_01780 [Clostridia bacterium]|nr:hypothetical protein [Clostridia bacterium]